MSFFVFYNTEASFGKRRLKRQWKEKSLVDIRLRKFAHDVADSEISQCKLYNHIAGCQFKLRMENNVLLRQKAVDVSASAAFFLQTNQWQMFQFPIFQTAVFQLKKFRSGDKGILNILDRNQLIVFGTFKRCADDAKVNFSLVQVFGCLRCWTVGDIDFDIG